MRPLPVPDPGTPDHRSATRYLVWLARVNGRAVAGSALLLGGWFGAQALMPAAIGRALDAIVDSSPAVFGRWLAVLAVLGLVQALSGVVGHRYAVHAWLGAAYRTVQVVTRQVTRLGATLPKRISAGEVVAVGTADIEHLGGGIEVSGRGVAALASAVIVAAVMLTTSVPLGLVVVLGVPAVMVALAPLLRRLHRRQEAHRELVGALTDRANDIVAGLRVLRGVGGESVFAARYRDESQRVRHAGVRVARVQAWIDAAQLLLPGLFAATVVWLGARFALDGQITPGQLVAYYGYAMFLAHPLWHLTDAAHQLTNAHVSARRVVRILQLRPEFTDAVTSATDAGGGGGGDLVDAASGLVVPAGALMGLASSSPEQAVAVADRLGRYAEGEVTWGGVPLADLPPAEIRRRIVVADNNARLFGGRLRDELDVRAETRGPAGEERFAAALAAACATDIVEALDDGLDTEISDAAREFSGGQRQRLLLARALLADPEVLILIEPTSAVDAHTEALIARRVAQLRRGRTTLVVTTSPLLLDRIQTVAYLEEGKVIATGAHRDLLTEEPRYAATVTRGEAVSA